MRRPTVIIPLSVIMDYITVMKKKLNQDQVIDQIIMIDEVIGEMRIENISNGRYCVYE